MFLRYEPLATALQKVRGHDTAPLVLCFTVWVRMQKMFSLLHEQQLWNERRIPPYKRSLMTFGVRTNAVTKEQGSMDEVNNPKRRPSSLYGPP